MLTIVVTAVFFFWLLIVSLVVYKIKAHYDNLISRTRKEKIDDILDLLLKNNKNIIEEINVLKKELSEEINVSKLHLQKVGLIRFNPFERIGGEQSFVIALLDKENNGLTLNFIYTKEGLRVYVKKVKNSKGEGYELSEEEKKAIEKSS